METIQYSGLFWSGSISPTTSISIPTSSPRSRTPTQNVPLGEVIQLDIDETTVVRRVYISVPRLRAPKASKARPTRMGARQPLSSIRAYLPFARINHNAHELHRWISEYLHRKPSGQISDKVSLLFDTGRTI